jgi:tetraacyldisaccharide 4'-kinase
MSIAVNLWYRRHWCSYLLWPLSGIYRMAVGMRRVMYRCKLRKTVYFPAPVIVVGNITVGGTGKTPLVIALANWLRQNGWRPGIVSRGYGGSATHTPQSVTPDSDPKRVGDEPVLISQKTGCPLVVCRKRVAAARALLENHDCNIIISDDGLQHFALGRAIEIAVVDGERRLGNSFCLPAGPLREPAHRLKTADFIVNNGANAAGEWRMDLLPGEIYQLMNPALRLSAQNRNSNRVHAVAGIGHPQRFFSALENAGFEIIVHPFPDHYYFKPNALHFRDTAPVIMTEKDAVKYRAFADKRHWCLPVTAKLPETFFTQLNNKLANIYQSLKT